MTSDKPNAKTEAVRLRGIINRASVQFFRDGADGETAAKMLAILNEATETPDAPAQAGSVATSLEPVVGRFHPSESSTDYFEQRARERAERQDGDYAGYKG